jgi:hypothetical protein
VESRVPFSARLCVNQHHWLAQRMKAEGIAFRQAGNMFLTCNDPARLQSLAEALTARDLDRGGQKWLRTLVPFSTPTERRVCAHRWFLWIAGTCAARRANPPGHWQAHSGAHPRSPRLLALMHALVRFAHIARGDTFTTRDLHPVAAARST